MRWEPWVAWSALAGMLAAGVVSDAHAYVKAGPVAMPGGHNVLKGATVQEGMATSLAGAYSFRKVRSAYAGSAVKLRRTTGGTSDIGFTPAGDFDTAAAAAFCAATTCFLDTWYDQSGAGRNATQATAGNQPAYVPNCIGDKPCARTTVAGQVISTAATVPVMPVSFSVMGHFGGGAGGCYWPFLGNNTFGTWNPNTWLLYDQVGYIGPVAADNAWHAGIGIMAGASSVTRIDDVETTGTIAGSVGVAVLSPIASGSGLSCSLTEIIYWSGYALTASERTALTQNQKNYWTPLPLDNFATPAAAYSMRRLKSAYSGPAIRLRRASDNAEADIPFLGYTGFTGAPVDTAAANAHCAATTCFGRKWYDQSGTGRDADQPSAAAQVQLVFNCQNGLPCFRAAAGAQIINTPGTYAPVAPVSFSSVANRDAGTGGCFWMTHYGANHWGTWAGVPNQWTFTGTAAAAADAAWHAGIAVLNGASSILRVDAAETGGTATASTTSSSWVALGGADGTICSTSEEIAWSGYALTAAERAALQANQKSFWGTP